VASDYDLILVGMSTRAAASSACRAGLRPWCVDCFADVDLQAMAPVRRVRWDQYPYALIREVAVAPAGVPLIYVGGLENHPSLYLTLARDRPVWGYLHPEPFQGDSVRNPSFLQALCDRSGLSRPALALQPHGLPPDGRWLVKPRAGAGGRGIARWRGQPLEAASNHYFQEFIPGKAISAVFVARLQSVELIGITKQFIGTSWLHAPSAFAYAGNVTLPRHEVSESLWKELERIGNILAQADTYLRGLFGVDVIRTKERVYMLEVNPRYTASVELHEYSTGRALLRDHVLAFIDRAPPTCLLPSDRPPRVAKAIYYAPNSKCIPSELSRAAPLHSYWEIPSWADIPQVGTQVKAGEPLVTLIAQGQNCEMELRQKAMDLDARLLRET
jgi:predicted ATP-grasp superfamily ATP-dependent carboligase